MFTGKEVIETDNFVFFWKPPAVFSQWTYANFIVDGIKYSCTEQYMMAGKAKLFSDELSYQKILSTNNPWDHQKLGRKVKNFSNEIWNENCLKIVTNGNFEKFKQNKDMLKILLETGDKILVEASPVDQIWGVGLAANDDRILDKSQWKGKNFLGKALMEVRKLLK